LWHDQSLTIGSDIGDSRPDMAIATDLPDPDTLAALAEGSRQLVLLVRSGQLPWVPRLVDGPKTLRLFGEVDSARDRGFALRQEIRNRIESAGEPNFELSAIEPLLYDHDPAVIAAALAASISATAAPAESTPEESWVRVFLTVGKKDGVAAGNIVGALLNETGLTKRDVGRVDIRESHALVEIKSNVASRAVAGMNGVMLKGRRITARLDRK
ncbi:MAG: DbpA RNA binding domain-containing protein, partial [Gemmatimonadales bacterium]